MKIKINHPKQDNNTNIENPDTTQLTIEDIQKLEDSVCTELYAGTILDYHINRNDMLATLAKKIRYGGELIIGGTDLLSVSLSFSSGSINSQQASDMLYNGKQSTSSLEYMCQTLTSMGFSINHTTTINNQYTIIAQRPNINVES